MGLLITRGERRRRTKRAIKRRRRLAKIKETQRYAVRDLDEFSDGLFRTNNFLCHYYGSNRAKRKGRQWFAMRYWRNRPRFDIAAVRYCPNERRQQECMDAEERAYIFS